jgi:hypothetical protein
MRGHTEWRGLPTLNLALPGLQQSHLVKVWVNGRAMRGPGECYGDVILKLANETSSTKRAI